MAKVAFVQFLFMHMLGPMHLSAELKKNGHACAVAAGSNAEIIAGLGRMRPDIVAFSSTSNERRWALSVARTIKERFGELPVVFGGPLATFSPEIIESPFVDMICRGEGEQAMLELCAAVDAKADFSRIRNLWVKGDDGRVARNELRPQARDLDALAFPDRELYDAYPFIRDEPSARVMATRGCPFDCSFCFEPAYRTLYADAGYRVRKRSPGNVVEELRILKEKYGKKRIWFIDDLFALGEGRWLGELLERYSREIALPFSCHTRADLVDEATVKMLKDCGYCAGISFGVETADETCRKEMLGKRIDNERIRNAAALLRRHRLPFSTTNMIGLPGERVENAIATISLNREIKAGFSVCTVYQPLPMTGLAKFALDRGYVTEGDFSRLPLFSHEGSLLRQEDIERLVNLHKFFYLVLYMPWLLPLVRLLIRLPGNIVFNMLYKISYFLLYMNKIHNYGPVRLLREGFIGLRYYHDKEGYGRE